ncbi:MAG: tRNA (adenosine(37)-N6)-dimethylallyltransferase MiaA [Pricia sp.]
MSLENKTLVSVVGPTGIGKTAHAISLAQHFDTDIISSDSRQFYKEMQIGTAVPSDDELAAARHHFIQHKSIFDSYSVGDFERDALRTLETRFKEKDVVIMVGGSGLYNNAVTEGLDEFPPIDPAIRQELNLTLKKDGLKALQAELKKRDAAYHEQVDLENPHRLIRALEVSIGTGKPYSSFLLQKRKVRPFRTVTVGFEADRAIIYERINQRVDVMVAEGLVAEANHLLPHRKLNALQTVGYKELFQYFDGQWTLDFAISEIKKNTRRFAKRQLTWFRRNEDTVWVPFDIAEKDLIAAVENMLKKDKAVKNKTRP